MDFRRQKRKSTLGTRNRDLNITFNAPHNNQSITSKYEGSFIVPYRVSENKAPPRSILGTHKSTREGTLPSTSDYLSCCENSSTVKTNFSNPERNSMITCHITDANQIIRNENLYKFNSSLLSPLKNLVLDVTLTKSMDEENQGDTHGCDSLSSLGNDSFISCNNSFNFEETTNLIEDTDVTLKRENILPASSANPTLHCENESERNKKIVLEDTISESTDRNDATLKIDRFSSPLKSCENLLSDKPKTNYSGHSFSPICSSTNTRKTNVQSSKHTKPKESLEDAYVVNKPDDVSRALKYLDALIGRSTTLVSNYEEQIKGVHLKLEDSKKELETLTTIREFMTEIIGVEKCGKQKKSPTICVVSNTEEKKEFSSPQYSPSRQVIQEIRSTIKFLKTPRMSRAPRQSMLLTPHTMSFCIKSQYEKLLE